MSDKLEKNAISLMGSVGEFASAISDTNSKEGETTQKAVASLFHGLGDGVEKLPRLGPKWKKVVIAILKLIIIILED